MAITDTPPFYLPSHQCDGGSVRNITLDAAGEKIGLVFQAPKTGNISKLAFCTRSVTTAVDTDLRLETVSLTDGMPTGTLVDTNTNIVVGSASVTANSVVEGTLTASAAVTKGDILAIVVAPSGTPDIQTHIEVYGSPTTFLPYIVADVGSGWISDSNNSGLKLLAVGYDDDTWPHIPSVALTTGLTNFADTFASDSTPDEVGIRFQVPMDMRVSGVWVDIDKDGDTDFVFYDSDGSTALATASTDKDVRGGTAQGWQAFLFSSAVTLTADTWYRATVKPTTTTTVSIRNLAMNVAAQLECYTGTTTMHRTERTDAGSWIDTTTEIPVMGLIIDGIDAGGGGLLTHPGMSGGMRS